MTYVTINKTGKIYIPKDVRKNMRYKRYWILSLPDGDIVLRPMKKSKNVLKDFEKLYDIKTSIPKAKKEILDEAMKSAGE